MKSNIYEHKNHIKMRVSKTTITILTICLFTIAGTQNLQAQTEEYSYYPRFMENFWKYQNLYTKMTTNQFLATKSGKKLIEDYEKGDKAVEDYNAGRSSDREYTLDQQYRRDQAKKRLHQFLDDEILINENEETRPLMDYYSELLVMSGWEARSWKIESTMEVDNDFYESGDNFLDDCEINTKISFSENGTYTFYECYEDYSDNCKCGATYGRWYLSGAKLYLEDSNGDTDFIYIWFMNNKLYAVDEYMEQVSKFSRSNEDAEPAFDFDPPSLPESLTGEEE